MKFLSLARSRRVAALQKPLLRNTTTATRFYSGPTVDFDHFTSGWSNVGDLEEFKKRGKYELQTFNKISPQGLATFPKDLYNVQAYADAVDSPAQALMLRSHKLQEEEVGASVRCIARCGAGTNNIPVARMTELGIPVFNTPGANANAVKEL
eukprot:scaffold1336_cov158-Cylindrotheca_fusiformis.AAC.1